jgi:hypothetical protein
VSSAIGLTGDVLEREPRKYSIGVWKDARCQMPEEDARSWGKRCQMPEEDVRSWGNCCLLPVFPITLSLLITMDAGIIPASTAFKKIVLSVLTPQG